MITVIIAGGSGTRLWPLSTPKYPKHLLKLMGERTLLQMAYDRANKLGDKIYIVTEASHSDYVREQLPELPGSAFLIEPGRRGTAHCIILALDYISRFHNHDEPVAFIHSDHHVRDVEGFAKSFEKAAKISNEKSQIALIGIEPTSPATGFGYIRRDIDGDGIVDDVFIVESFKEKPDYDTAVKYLESGEYLWNCGYFVGSVNTFLNEMKRSSKELHNNFKTLSLIDNVGTPKYNEAYLSLDNQVIDIALIEKAKELMVVAASFDWMDVGSFQDLHKAVLKDGNNNYSGGGNIHMIEVANAYIRNEEPLKPIAVIGMDDVVIVNTPDGILISKKDVSHRTGEVAKKLQSNS
ncbi:hypothetical protein CVV43_05310 [Candidatus Saccharibacteria bacterium HGW-Saccharibacteria-1]|jgi:mannose-1-phosphate guanylyltransferase/mannose-6-phosphate isomerase|nr:MAG: hypothetical protein CVV43_05310 [Candidatus Saccharibacteria bacterium HGW-Saccharibacteria-1]